MGHRRGAHVRRCVGRHPHAPARQFHAYRPGVPFREQREHDLLSIRDVFLRDRGDFGKIVVHGHTPSPVPELRPNRINVDTGAFITGRLTCAVLEEEQPRFLSVT